MAILVRWGTEVSYNIGSPLASASILIRVVGGGSLGPGARRLSHLRPCRGRVTRAVSGCQAIGRNLGNLGAETRVGGPKKKTHLFNKNIQQRVFPGGHPPEY